FHVIRVLRQVLGHDYQRKRLPPFAPLGPEAIGPPIIEVYQRGCVFTPELAVIEAVVEPSCDSAASKVIHPVQEHLYADSNLFVKTFPNKRIVNPRPEKNEGAMNCICTQHEQVTDHRVPSILRFELHRSNAA